MNEDTTSIVTSEKSSERTVVPFEKTNIVGVEGTSLRELSTLAQTLYASGLAPSSIRSWQALFAVILQGQELGLPPSFSMNNIYVVHNRPQLGGRAVFALVTRDFGGSAIVIEKRTEDFCTASYTRPEWKGERRRFTYTVEMAAKAGLLLKQDDGSYLAPDQAKGVPTWDGYRPEMLQWKCVARIGSIAFPDALGGLSVADDVPEMPVDVTPTDAELETEYVKAKRNAFWDAVGDTELADPARRERFLLGLSHKDIGHLTEFITTEDPAVVENMLVQARRIADYERQKRDEDAKLQRQMEEKGASDRRALASRKVRVGVSINPTDDLLPGEGGAD